MASDGEDSDESTGELELAKTGTLVGETPVLGKAPRGDPLLRAVSRAKIEAELFAGTEQVKLGRYHLLELVGAGGMGVVWGAWDPELDRRVAIKLVKAELASARDRILLEGQALAKLSHPNVVPVHDVGVVDEQIYIVMEWVRGKNLRAYCKERRSVREILEVYRAAGEGLSAAHHANLVHRDFKPDNAILGDDGRVRVLDFGLARGELKTTLDDSGEPTPGSDLTRGAGTPRYMPPEQADGTALTHAADQYAFCVSLREGLKGRNADGNDASVPSWLGLILDRGTAHQPAKRYPSMDELLDALSRDPATVWRRRLIVIGALGATGAAFAVGSLSSDKALEPCVGGKAEIARSWNPLVRDRMATHLRSLGPYGVDEATRIQPEIASYADRWASAHRGACIANQRRELPPELYARNVGCLERSRAAYDTVLDVLATVPGPRLSDAVFALHGLPDVDRCVTDAKASTVTPPATGMATEVARLDREIESTRMRALSADQAAPAKLAELAIAADRTQYLPIVARAHLVHGFALTRIGRNAAALPELEHAIAAAVEAGDDVAFVEAYARQAQAYGVVPEAQRPSELAPPLQLHKLSVLVAKRLQTAGAFVRPLLYNNLGLAHIAAQNEQAARTWLERALAEWTATKEPSVELMFIPANLALVSPSRDEQKQLVEQAGARLAARLGPHHPFALQFQLRAAMFVQDPTRAATLLHDACTQLHRFHGHLVTLFNSCAYELAWLAEERADVDEARSLLSAIQATTGSQDPQPTVARVQLLAVDGKHENAARESRAVAARFERATEWWFRVFAADALLVAARSNAELGHRSDAIAMLREALAVVEDLTLAKSQTYYQRRLARVRATLAKLLAASNRPADRAAAAQLGRDAIAWYRLAGGYGATIAELERLTGSR